jgi:hypothetical protein
MSVIVAVRIVLVGGVADRRRREGHVIQRDVADGAVGTANPHRHRLGRIAVTALDRQVHVVRQRVDGSSASRDSGARLVVMNPGSRRPRKHRQHA